MTRFPRTIIRISRQSLAFALPVDDSSAATAGVAHYEPFTVKSGMSIAANLRDAFRESIILKQPNDRAQVLVDAPVLLVPMEEYDEEKIQQLYGHTFPGHDHERVMWHVMPDLNCVAVFAVNRDTCTVVNDHYEDVRVMPLLVPVWQHLHQRSYSGGTRKLYAYFHDRQLSVFAFGKNRLRFANTFNATDVTDSAYFILYVWQQLAMDHKKDELYYVGDMDNKDALKAELKKYVQNVFHINPSAEFNRAPLTQQPHVTYDVVCYVEG